MPIYELVLKENFTIKDVYCITRNEKCTFIGWTFDHRGQVLKVNYDDERNVPNLSQYSFIKNVEKRG